MSIVGFAVTSILAAFVLYTAAVWAERFAGRLKAWHLLVFWLGFVADTAGTSAMFEIGGGPRTGRSLVMTIHGTTGMLALVLMFVHCAWASLVLVRRDEAAILKFHRFSLFVWCVWLVPFLIGGAMEGLR